MKKTILTATIILSLSFGAMAQSDGFFSSWSDYDNMRDDNGIELPGLPNGHGYGDDQDAPVGSGLLILTALGAGYAVAKRKRN